MRVITDEGYFLAGTPEELVARLGERVLVGAGAHTALLSQECNRISRYQREIGPSFARFAAYRLLMNLEEEGLILLQHE